MAYLPVDPNLPRSRKTISLAAELGRDVSRWAAAGLLVDVWAWAVEHAKDGRVNETAHIESLATQLSARKTFAQRLLRAMAKTGWIDPETTSEPDRSPAEARSEPDRTIGLHPIVGRLHEWDEWGGRVVKAREEDALRKRLWREHERGVHTALVPDCRRCARLRPGGRNVQRPADSAPAGVGVSSGQPPRVQVDAAAASRGIRARAPDTSLSTERRAIGHPPEVSSGRAGAGPVAREVGPTGEGLVRQVLDGAGDPRWRDALQALLIGGMTAANLATWFGATTLEERGGWAIVRAPNEFARERLATKYRAEVARALGLESSRIVFAVAGRDVVLEPEPVEDGEAT